MKPKNFIVYIINLDKDKDRRSYVEKELKRVGIINYNFISAVDGSMLPQKDLEHYSSNNRFWPKMSPGQVGVSMSHINIYKSFLATKYDYALVLEDDVVFNKFFNLSLIDKILLKKFKKKHIILLSEIATFFKKSKFKINNEFNLVKVIKAGCSHSYLIDKYAAKQMVRKNDPVKVYADDFHIFQEIWSIGIFGINPPVTDQNKKVFDTTIYNEIYTPRFKMRFMSFSKFDYHLIMRLIKIKYEFLGIFSRVKSHTKS